LDSPNSGACTFSRCVSCAAHTRPASSRYTGAYGLIIVVVGKTIEYSGKSSVNVRDRDTVSVRITGCVPQTTSARPWKSRIAVVCQQVAGSI